MRWRRIYAGNKSVCQREKRKVLFCLIHCTTFIEISYLQVTEKKSLLTSIHNKLSSSSLSSVHTWQLCRREHKRMGAIMTHKCFSLWNNYMYRCTMDQSCRNVSKVFSLLVHSFWIANLYYGSWLTWQCKESCLYMYVMSVKSTGFTGFCCSGFWFSKIC